MRPRLLLPALVVLSFLLSARPGAAQPVSPPPLPPPRVPTPIQTGPSGPQIPAPGPFPYDTSQQEPFDAVRACRGTSDLLTAPDLRHGRAPTVWETYCNDGYTWTQELGWRDARQPANLVGNVALSGVANLLFGAVTALTSTSITLVQWAFSPRLTLDLGDGVQGIVEALRGVIYSPYLLACIVLAGVWGAWHGLLRRRASVAMEGWTWTLLALVFATWFLARPADFLHVTNGATVAISNQILTGVAAVDPGTLPDDGLRVQADLNRASPDDSLRLAADRIHRVLVHTPWLIGEFGSLDVGRTYGQRLLETRTISAQEWDNAHGDPAQIKRLLKDKAVDYDKLKTELRNQYPDAWEWFRGGRATQRIQVALLALVAAVLSALVVLLIAAGVVLLQLAALLLVVTSPLFLLIGIHPGIGRVIALRWLELLAGTIIKRIFLAAVLAILIVSYGVIMTSSQKLGWAPSVALISVLGIAAVLYRKPFLNLFSQLALPVQLGGQAGRNAAAAVQAQRTRPIDRALQAASTYALMSRVRDVRRDGSGSQPSPSAPARDGDSPGRAGGAPPPPAPGTSDGGQAPPPRGPRGGPHPTGGPAPGGAPAAHDMRAAARRLGMPPPGHNLAGALSRRGQPYVAPHPHPLPPRPLYTPLPTDPVQRAEALRAQQQAAASGRPGPSPVDRARREQLVRHLEEIQRRRLQQHPPRIYRRPDPDPREGSA